MRTKRRKQRSLATDSQRRTWRLWSLASLGVVALAAIVFAVKTISIGVSTSSATGQFESRAFALAAQSADPPNFWNFLEPWKAPFNRGTARVMAGNFEEAMPDLDEAIRLHGEPQTREQVVERCIMEATVVTALERQGDVAREAEDTAGANAMYNNALARLAAAPEGCMEEPQPGEPNIREQMTEAKPRIEAKIEEEGGNDENEDESEDEGSEDDEPKTPEEELEQQNEDAQTEQQQQDNYDESGPGEEAEPEIDRPW